MNEVDLSDIVIKYLPELEKAWYKINKDNEDYIINWFIKIAKSIMDNRSEEEIRIEIWNILSKIEKKYFVPEESYKDYIPEVIEDFEFDLKPLLNTKLFEKLREYINKKRIQELDKDILENNDGNFVISDDIKEKNIIDLLNQHNLIEKFNKWELNETDNRIIIYLLNKIK